MLANRKSLRWNRGCIVPFTVYLDDSGTSPSQYVACATALIVPAGRIFHMEREWENLKQKEGFSDFHTSEFVARNHHSEFATWDQVKLERVFRRVRQITKKYVVQIFSFAVKKDDYEECVPYELRKFAGKYHYSWAMRHVARFAQTWRIDRNIAEPFELLFDWMEPKDEARKEVETVMEQAEEEARSQRGVEDDYTHFGFRRRGTLAALQCADLVAWTNYNFALEKFRNKPVHPFARLAWDDFASMPIDASQSIHKVLEWNFAVTLKRNHLQEWAKKEIEDGRSLIRFQEWEARKKAQRAQQKG
jgi:Protein of unknown function (DUF3800)